MTSLEEIRDLLNRYDSEGSPDSLTQALPYTRHNDSRVRSLATAACTSIIKRILLDPLLELDADTRRALVNLVARLSGDVVGLFYFELQSPDMSLRTRAVQTLGLATDAREDVIKCLSDMVRGSEERLRATIITALGQLVAKREAAILLPLLNDLDERVRANTVEALGSLDNANLVGVLSRFRYDPNNRIRANALKALFGLGYRNIWSSLDQMVKSESPRFRASAAWLIGEIAGRDPQVLRILARIRFSDSALVRRNVIRALLKIDTEVARVYLDTLFTPSEVLEVREVAWLQNETEGGDDDASADQSRSA